MNKPSSTVPSCAVAVSNRRLFLKTAGAALAGSTTLPCLALPAKPSQSRWWHGRNRLALDVSGPLDPGFILPPLDPAQLGALIGFLIGQLGFTNPVFTMRLIFPIEPTKDLLAVRIFVADQVPNPAPAAPYPFSYADVEITDFQLGTFPVISPPASERRPAFSFQGIVVSNAVKSPFGDLTGGVCTASGGFQVVGPNDEASFAMVALTVAGSHTTVLPAGTGMIRAH